MSHEPECPAPVVIAGVARGVDVAGNPMKWEVPAMCQCDLIRAAYRRGYNDHARTVQHWQDTHGAYRQHGEGTNP